jgi:hypothetical protein
VRPACQSANINLWDSEFSFTGSDSIYDDSPAERYQFHGQYLDRAEACVGDWIIYYEPRKITETRGYFALAKVERVGPDLQTPGMYLALIEPGSYFVNPVPFRNVDGLVERGLLNEQGRISGRAQAAITIEALTRSVPFNDLLSTSWNTSLGRSGVLNGVYGVTAVKGVR